MDYSDLGYTDSNEKFRVKHGLESFEKGRVVLEHKERYIIKTPQQDFEAELIGNLRFTAESRSDFPAVGDWVAFSVYDEDKALIHTIYPRYSVLERKAVAQKGQAQIIATNIDYGLIVQAVDRDFNLNRLERYIAICHASKVKPIVILSKIDLILGDELEQLKAKVSERIHELPVFEVSYVDNGYKQLLPLIEKGQTYCLLGSSGVGKSTLLNAMVGTEIMKTNIISDSVNKGKHTTTHRELIVLEAGGILIDNPGMRELGLANSSDGLDLTFDSIMEFAQACHYKDCTHMHEKGCAVVDALNRGDINEASYENFQKMEKEKTHYESDVLERKKKDKSLGKVIRNYQKQRKDHKF